MREWVIYALSDPRTEQVRYVGKTVRLDARVKDHLRDRGTNRKARWLTALVAAGLEPLVTVLQRGTDDWQAAECAWIAHYRAAGADLTNLTPGGDGVTEMAPETRALLSAAQRRLYQDPAWRAAAEARYADPERRAKLSAALSGREAPWARTLPQNTPGYRPSDQAAEAHRAALNRWKAKGLPAGDYQSPARRAHLQRINSDPDARKDWTKGLKMTPEGRRVRSEALLGRPKSPEHTEKIRQGALRRWAKVRAEGNVKHNEG